MLTLEETIARIHSIADALLTRIALEPESRFMISLPSLMDGQEKVPFLDCQEYNYAIARLREVLIYKYLLISVRVKQLTVDRELLSICLANMRLSPVIDYYDLGDYHEFAFYYYKKLKQEQKAMRHLLSCYQDRGRAIFSAHKTFDCKEMLLMLMKDHQRMRAFLLYVVHYILNDFEEFQPYLKRTQYLLLERSLLLAKKLFAEQPHCGVDLRSCIYYAEWLYAVCTNRVYDAQVAKKNYLLLGGERVYAEVFENVLLDQPKPHLSDVRFVDYLLYRNSMEDFQIYPTDELGNLNLNYEYDDFNLAKDGRVNFMDLFYRNMCDASDFKRVYEAAERGNVDAIREVAKRYLEGEGVAPSASVAATWYSILEKYVDKKNK